MRPIHTLRGNAAVLCVGELARAARSLELKSQAGEIRGLEDSGLAVLAIEATKAKAMMVQAVAGMAETLEKIDVELRNFDPQEVKVHLIELFDLSNVSDMQVLERCATERSKLLGLPEDIQLDLEMHMQNLAPEEVSEVCSMAIEWCCRHQSS